MGSTPVLIHGFTGSGGAWGPEIVDGLAGAGFAPAAIDLPGHGRNRGQVDPVAYSIEAVLAEIGGASEAPSSLLGYSMGGRLALHCAVRFPDRVARLVLESASPGLPGEQERRIRQREDFELADRILRVGIEAFVEEWAAQPLFASQARLPRHTRERVAAGRLANDPASLAASLRALGTGSLSPLWDELSDFQVPTLIVVGALDSKFVQIGERMADAMPNARLVVVPDAGHCVHLERPRLWVEAVTEFLKAPQASVHP
ncbi:MAG: 2-succinyl-6-hydroxy-2,4-cyclohexadiene-1-carboxylate synthase [Gemmatimonadetes bacterium]|nr:2-succinyl-6-hydroxy-2,4-cyclohexadiene-1-carboxylate synthase [Gemmatimonadota bacterium]MDA1102429.1 2-succinyl-6-hydroxy-2,4-cyclohexadiene-1-carboxylate synthase [Gemmatimonadota bacterium]